MKQIFLLPVFFLALILFSCSQPEGEGTTPETSNLTSEVVIEEPEKEPVEGPITEEVDTPVKAVTNYEANFVYNLWNELGDHPLDKDLRACVDGNPGDMGIRNCLRDALSAWNDEVAKWSDEIGNQLLRGESAESFKASQTAWETFKESEFLFIEKKYEGMNGTMFLKRMKMEKVIVVRHRGLQLYNYQQALNVDR